MSKTLAQIIKRFREAVAESDDYLSRVHLFVSTSVRPSVRVEQLHSWWTHFLEVLFWKVLLKFVEKIQVSLKSKKMKSALNKYLRTSVLSGYDWCT
jgi:hypothetical protein